MPEAPRAQTAGEADGYPVEYWVQPEELASVAYAGYWNDEEVEKVKRWDVAGRGFAELDRHLQETGLLRQLSDCVAVAARLGRPFRGVGADLACGVLWAAPALLEAGAEKVYGVEYSSHRLLKIGPLVLRRHSVPSGKVTLCLGSFYELKLQDRSLDFVLMAEAFHHADDPERLLREIRRVLRPEGVVLLVGEHIVGPAAYLYAKNAAKFVASRLVPEGVQRRLLGHTIVAPRLLPSLEELLRPDPVAGDHYYLAAQYAAMFSRQGFAQRRVLTKGCRFQAFVLTPG